MKIFWLTASALAGTLAMAGAAQAGAASPFSGETVFGDSLSDGGNLSIFTGLPSIMRFTTNPGQTTVEDVAQFYGLTLKPSLQGGTNYAYGGSGVTTNAPSTPAGVPNITQQVTGYLAANPKLNGSELYTVFGGANDIFYHATATAVGQFVASNSAGLNSSQVASLTALVEQVEGVTSTETSTEAYTNVTTAASQELSLIGSLQKAGARYIVVFNLPDIGRTPEAAQEEALVPGTKAGLTTLSTGFNGVLNAGLASAGVGIIPVNTYALLNEVLASPAEYGFVNSTTPACTTASSLNCTRSTLVAPDAYTNYVFADGVHPTTYTHSLFAQVVESEIIAPQQMSLLAEEPLATLEAERNAVTGQLLSDQLDRSTGLRLFATGGYVRQHLSSQAYTPSAHDDDGLITAGVDDRVTPDFSFGGELSGGTASEALNGELRRFHTSSIMGSIFAAYEHGQAYVTGQGGLGALQFNDIERLFAIGPATRVENGSVSGQTYSVGGTAGYWFGQRALRAGPFVGLAYEHVHINRYSEDGSDSTAMLFGEQDRESLISEAGLRLQGALPFRGVELHPFAEAAFAYDADARTRDVLAGLNTMNGVFAIPGFSPDREWGEAQAGLEAGFGRWTASIAYQGRFAGASSGYDGGRIGLRYAF
jgi:outer membrane lipase/esterase